MQTPEGLEVIPTSHGDVVALLQSAPLADVEQTIASRCGAEIDYDNGTAAVSGTQGEISVCGLTTNELEQYLVANRERLIKFGVRFLSDEEATSEQEEYPEGEEPDPDDDDEDDEGETIGYGNGFGITIAIYHNFLANRTAAELRADLKNRRIPRHTVFAKDLTRVFAESESLS